MNKLTASILLGLFLIACQNTPKNTPESSANVPELPPPAPVESLKQSSAKLEASLKSLSEIRDQVDALPEALRKAKRDEIDNIYATIEGMTEKQTSMLNGIKSTLEPPQKGQSVSQESEAPNGVDVTQLAEFDAATERYTQEIEAMKATLNNWTAPAKKQ